MTAKIKTSNNVNLCHSVTGKTRDIRRWGFQSSQQHGDVITCSLHTTTSRGTRWRDVGQADRQTDSRDFIHLLHVTGQDNDSQRRRPKRNNTPNRPAGYDTAQTLPAATPQNKETTYNTKKKANERTHTERPPQQANHARQRSPLVYGKKTDTTTTINTK